MANRLQRIAIPVFLCVLASQLIGCATLLNGPDQMVAFSSDPDGATVIVDGIPMGKTPCTLPIPRKGGDKLVTFELAGHKHVQYTLKNTLSGALAGNILLGGFIGLGVDAISGRGGGYQRSVSVVLESGFGTYVYDNIPIKTEESLVDRASSDSSGDY